MTPRNPADRMNPLAAQYFHEMLMRAGMVPFSLPPHTAWLIASDIWATLPETDVQANIFGAPAFEVPGFPDGMVRLVGAAIDGTLDARAILNDSEQNDG